MKRSVRSPVRGGLMILAGSRLPVLHAAAAVVEADALDRAQHEATGRELQLLVDAVQIPHLLANAIHPVDDIGAGGVAGADLAREEDLGPRALADDVAVAALEPPRFRGRLEARADRDAHDQPVVAPVDAAARRPERERGP